MRSIIVLNYQRKSCNTRSTEEWLIDYSSSVYFAYASNLYFRRVFQLISTYSCKITIIRILNHIVHFVCVVILYFDAHRLLLYNVARNNIPKHCDFCTVDETEMTFL